LPLSVEVCTPVSETGRTGALPLAAATCAISMKNKHLTRGAVAVSTRLRQWSDSGRKEAANKCLPCTGHLAPCARIADSKRSIARHDVATGEDGSRTPGGFRPGLARRLPGVC